MRPGDDLQVAVGIPSSSSLSWIDRVQLHPTTLKQLGIQSATPAILALQPEDQSEPLIRIANIWPRSTLELGAIHLPAHMQGSKYQIKSVKVYPVKRTSESTLPKATEVKFELLESSRKDAELDEESRQLLQCWAREHLVSCQYATIGQELCLSLQSAWYQIRIASITQNSPFARSILPLDIPDAVKNKILSSAAVTRSSIISICEAQIANGNDSLHKEPSAYYAKLQEESAYATLGGLDEQIDELKRLVEMPLRSPEIFQRYGLRPPRGLLLFGPPGTGKTTLAYSAAKSCVEASSIEIISGPELTSSLHGGTERALRKVFARARQNSPSVVIIDEIDALAPRRDGGDASSDGAGEVEKRVVATLLTLMDGLSGTDDSSRVVVIAATNRPNAIDPALRRPGRLDREIEVGIPTRDARLSILSVLLRHVPNSLNKEQVEEIANRTHGYVGADLSALVREAGMRAVTREMVSPPLTQQLDHLSLNGKSTFTDEGLTLVDFTAAQAIIRPSAMREISLELPKVTWNDIAPGQAGLAIQQKVRECVEWPLKHKSTMERLGVTAPRGVLLYGPPGCSKTLIARALASESGLNFVAVKGPELLNKYVGESERALREVFRKARAASPSIVFFDEIDGLTTTRGSESASSDKIIATLLNEMDGIEQLNNVLVVAATNRPEVIDPALLRPGRLDRILYVAPPDVQARRQILQLRSKKMILAQDVNLDKIALLTEGCSGAEVVSICQEAGLTAMNEDLNAKCIEQRHLESACHTVQRRITKVMIAKYESWRDQSGL